MIDIKRELVDNKIGKACIFDLSLNIDRILTFEKQLKY
jgi:hypothetical protein